jgi:hypothetical protein
MLEVSADAVAEESAMSREKIEVGVFNCFG